MTDEQQLGTTTVLFTDQVGSTRYLSDNGEGAADEARRRHLDLVRRVVSGHGGEFVKNLGDGAMAVFDSAVAGVAAAVDIQEGGSPDDPGVRIGMSSGDVIVEQDDYFGTPVVIASRLCGRARAGQILVTRIVVDLAGTRIEHRFHPVGSLSLRGIADPVPVSEVGVGDGPVRGVDAAPGERGTADTPLPGPLRAARGVFVGRTREVDVCREALQTARTGIPQVVVLEGEAGMGKTRLASQVAVEAHRDGALVLLGRCEPDDPFGPFKQVVESTADILGDDAFRSSVARVGSDLLHLSPRLKQRFPALSPDGADDGDRFRLFDSVRAWLTELAAEQPVVIVLDDFHAADAGSLALARHLGRSSISAHLMLMATVRTDLADDSFLELMADLQRLEIVTRVAVGGLPPEDVDSLATDWAGHPVADAVIRRLASATGATRSSSARCFGRWANAARSTTPTDWSTRSTTPNCPARCAASSATGSRG